MKKIIAFDFDGVIADTLQKAFLLHVKHNPHLTWDMFMKMSHGNWWNIVESDETAAQFRMHDDHVYEYREMLTTLTLRTEIDNAIRSLYEKGYYLTIVSSGFEESIKGYLKQEGILEYFDSILGFDTHKSKVEKFKMLFATYNAKPDDIVFITDTLGDILEANEVGIKTIAETWGLHDKETLVRGNPEVIIDDPYVLEETIEKVLNG